MRQDQNKNTIPGFDLGRQNCILHNDLIECISGIIKNGKFILGENVELLEKNISRYCGAAYGIGVASGSDALYLSLSALEIGPGDEVITTPFSFFATAGSISRVGAKPVFVDINPETFNIDVNLIEKKINRKTRAIIPVHLYGCPADMKEIFSITESHNIKIIEDAAQALGASYNKHRTGSLGDTGCFSFFPTKNLGSFGDGGMIVTNNIELAEKIRLLRVHGSKKKYFHDFLGFNSRLDELQAAVLNVKFKYLEQWTKRRRVIARLYNVLLKEQIDKGRIHVKLPLEPDNALHVYHQYTIQTQRRNQLQRYLHERGIGSTVYYPSPLHLQKAFSFLGHKHGDYPVSERACSEVLSLPVYPELTDEEVIRVVEAVVDFF
ncbi:DegT/DnrJ/EryC1/StrS family aminotransferase [Candidatus Contubernalis alkaliaceticus]|uniref:DegT/DnrJ/EryC1/StrS family aminotransferase n=1 Tax=Candidatus Contubernalis alkaliaceticus TaxID=338645 RepID=UPI001F4BFD0A|nr:DegT/DnrJ/EryC1/StrS family aminotransferase [Candidatus Contubernalis alkalaceticus]UNC92309.1 DegT/DnrJ/EryC1/StrS family aminotransferase [Candidatus Contubernalis alkalaceticus]